MQKSRLVMVEVVRNVLILNIKTSLGDDWIWIEKERRQEQFLTFDLGEEKYFKLKWARCSEEQVWREVRDLCQMC